MTEFIAATSNTSSGQASIFTAPKIENFVKVHPTDNIIRYANTDKSFASGMGFPRSAGYLFSNQSSIFQISNIMDRNIDLLLLKVARISTNEGFGQINNSVISFSKKTILSINKKGILTHNVYALDDGGISIEINERNGDYINISYYNDGTASLIKNSNNKIPEAWEMDFENLFKKALTII